MRVLLLVCSACAVACAGPRLPTTLGPASKVAPDTVQAWLKEADLIRAGYPAYEAATKPLVGAKVRWALRSWGGELNSEGFETPEGSQGPKYKAGDVGRVRFVAPSFGPEATLTDVAGDGYPVFACLALMPSLGGTRFARSDGRKATAPAQGVVTVDATVWGSTDEGQVAIVWLHDCEIVPDAK